MIEPLQSIAYFVTDKAQQAGIEPGKMWFFIYASISAILVAWFWMYQRKYR